MVSEVRRGCIINSIIFSKGQLRLKYNEPDNENDRKIEKPKMRPCLGDYGKKFMSAWIGNRICLKCTDKQKNEPEYFRVKTFDIEDI
ncbi:MAG: hypothetical protein V1709_00830 [Planctomycetota bacterium]